MSTNYTQLYPLNIESEAKLTASTFTQFLLKVVQFKDETPAWPRRSSKVKKWELVIDNNYTIGGRKTGKSRGIRYKIGECISILACYRILTAGSINIKQTGALLFVESVMLLWGMMIWLLFLKGTSSTLFFPTSHRHINTAHTSLKVHLWTHGFLAAIRTLAQANNHRSLPTDGATCLDFYTYNRWWSV